MIISFGLIIRSNLNPKTRLEILELIRTGKGNTLYYASFINSISDLCTATSLYVAAILTQEDHMKLLNLVSRIQSFLPPPSKEKLNQFHISIFGFLIILNIGLVAVIFYISALEQLLIWQIVFFIVVYATEILTLRIVSSIRILFTTIGALKLHFMNNKSALSMSSVIGILQDIAESIRIFNRSNQFAIMILCCRLLTTNCTFSYAMCYLISLNLAPTFGNYFVLNIIALVVINVKLIVLVYMAEGIVRQYHEIIILLAKVGSEKKPIKRFNRDQDVTYSLHHRNLRFNCFSLFRLDRELVFLVRI